MSIEQFWYCTEEELQAYIKAYYNHMNQYAWLQGLYNYQAQTSALSMLVSKKKSDVLEYPKQPIETNTKPKEEKTAIEKDQEFRNLLLACY